MTSSKNVLVDNRANKLFDKQIVLNQKQYNALKNGTIVDSLRAGVDLDIIKIFSNSKNYAVL